MAQADDIDTRRLSLGEHLEELRRYILRALGWLALATAVCLCFQDRLMDWATWPHRKCMADLAEKATFAEAKRALSSGFVHDVDAALEGQTALEKQLSELDRKATIIKTKLDEDPSKKVDGIAARETELATEAEAIEKDQEALISKPDDLAYRKLEDRRAALAAKVGALKNEVQAELVPLANADANTRTHAPLIQLTYTESFMSYLKVAIICALFVASPLMARELWKFVAAGLHSHEKRYVRIFAPLTLIAFMIGGAFGYFILIPAGLSFLATYGSDYITSQFQLSEYLSLFISLTAMVGLIFELPLVMAFLTLIGFTTDKSYKRFRRYWIVVAFIIATLISPTPDPFTQALCAVPMILLYEIGILWSRAIVRRREREHGPSHTPAA